MEDQELFSSILRSETCPGPEHLLNTILLPRKQDGSSYSLEEIEEKQKVIHNQIEQSQRKNNDDIDKIVLNEETKSSLLEIFSTLHDIQLDTMKLQCEIAFTREQFYIVQGLGDNSLVKNRRKLLMRENSLVKTLEYKKFENLKIFFDCYANYLGMVIVNCKRLIAKQTSGYLQFFDWSHYQHTIYLLRACGKVLSDIERFERLFQQGLDISSIKFKQPISKMDLNNFIDFPDSYSLETQLEIVMKPGQRLHLKEWNSDPMIRKIFASTAPIEWSIFKDDYLNFKKITIDCCRLLVDINMSYIEAHLTTGINVDKLNGIENSSPAPDEQEHPLPLYALSPQEYIIQIGQHLLTLRKQSEHYDTIDNDSLKLALQFAQEADTHIDLQSNTAVSDSIMKGIAKHCVRSLLGRTGASILSRLTPAGKRQLATDVSYLNSVMEDLGILDKSDPNVDRFKHLLTY